MSSAIRNNISDGLSGLVANYSYSIEQLEDEVILMRAKLLTEWLRKGVVNIKYFYQTFGNVSLIPVDISVSPELRSYVNSLGFSVPRIISTINDDNESVLAYTLDRSRQFKVYRSINFRDHKYKLKTKRAPFVYLDTSTTTEGMLNGYLMNTGKYESIRAMIIQAVFSNPMDVPGYTRFKEFPAPLEMQNDIISRITGRYVNYYRQLNLPKLPNTQTSPV